jgi:hypothetical protein
LVVKERNGKTGMKQQWKYRSRILTLFIALMTTSFVGCKEENSATEPVIDPVLDGVWYSSDYGVGFEVQSDGSSKTLVVDTSGKLQYNPTGADVNSALVLTITKAKAGNLTAILRYKQPGIDTTMTLPGTYALSNNGNTLSVTIPNPLSTVQQITVVFIRSAIGEIVRPKS